MSSAFRTGPDRLSAELSALGTRQVRTADLIVNHGAGLVGARLVWRADKITVAEDGPATNFTTVAVDTTGDLQVTMIIETNRDHDVVGKHAVIENVGDRRLTMPRVFAPAWELPIGPGAIVTGPRDRLAIQFGLLSAFAPHLMSSWVTDQPSPLDAEPVSFEFRFVVAMAGVLGIGSDLLAWNAAERQLAAELIKLYREIRPSIYAGRVQRHGTPADPFCAVEYATASQIVILVWARTGRSDQVRIAPTGLAPDGQYLIRGRSGLHIGADLAAGIDVPFRLAVDTDVIILDRQR